MDYQLIILQKQNGVARITLNRPERLNALNWNSYEELAAAFDECEYDDDVRAVVITGAGRGFCTGEDLKGFWTDKPMRRIPKMDGFDLKAYLEAYAHLMWGLLDLPKPVVAMINGPAYGAGLDMTLACDFRIASEKATFCHPLISRGISAGGVLLPRHVSIGKATEILFLGDPIDAKEAERIGLVNKTVPHDQLESTVGELAGRLAKGATKAMSMTKRSMNHELYARFQFEAYTSIMNEGSEDVKESGRAFMEKREPRFKGK